MMVMMMGVDVSGEAKESMGIIGRLAVSKTKDAKVRTFLFGLQFTDMKEPLAQFQATKAEESDVRGPIKVITGM